VGAQVFGSGVAAGSDFVKDCLSPDIAIRVGRQFVISSMKRDVGVNGL
jgi:hypothetical protein